MTSNKLKPLKKVVQKTRLSWQLHSQCLCIPILQLPCLLHNLPGKTQVWHRSQAFLVILKPSRDIPASFVVLVNKSPRQTDLLIPMTSPKILLSIRLPTPSLSAVRWYDARHEWILYLMKDNIRTAKTTQSAFWTWLLCHLDDRTYTGTKEKNIYFVVCPASAISIPKGWVFSAKKMTNQIFEIDDLFIWQMSK